MHGHGLRRAADRREFPVMLTVFARAGAFLLLLRLTAAAQTTDIATESKRANDFFERVFSERVDRTPELQTQLGIKKDYDKWDDDSELRAAEDFARLTRNLYELKRDIAFERLDPQTQLSYRLYVRQAERLIEGYKWRHY